MMADRRRWSPESSARRRRDHKHSQHDRHPQYEEPERMRSRAESPSSSSTSSSYLDISHIYPYKTGLRSFFTAPSERRRLRKRRSNRSLGGHSSSSSLNLDLAYGTGYIRRPRRREVRSRKGKEIDREKNRETRREKESNHQPTDAEILAVGAGLAKLARDQNKLDLKSSRNGKRAELVAVKEPAGSRGLGPSKVSHGSDTVDEDGWESASDDGSISSVDSRLAFGDQSGGWFGWSRPKPPPPSRKTSVVDPRFFGPANSLHGVVTEAVGFQEVTWDPSADHGKDNPFPIPRLETPPSGSQGSLQRVYPVATNDPSRFEAARSSVVSGSEPFVSSKHGELPLQQPQPYSPVSKNVFEPRYSAPSESGGSKKSSSHSRSKSLAEAALAGVAVATAGAAIASERRDERSDRRRESDRRDPRDDRRREKRQSPDREERREKRREKERRRDSDAPSSDKRRERRYDDPRYYDDREDRREKRREDRPDTRYTDSYYGGQSSSTRVPVDPFQYQVADDAFETPKSESPVPRKMGGRTPTVVTVEREPDFSRFANFASSSSRVEPKESSGQDDKETRRGKDSEVTDLNDPQPASEGTGRAAATGAAIGAAVAAASAERARKAVERRRDRGDDYDRREKYSAKEPEPKSKPARDPVQEEADRAYREIVMARKIASQVIRSRSPSPNRSVVEKYEGEDEPEEVIEIVTPRGPDEEEEKEKEKEKKKGPYDAPDADFKLDLVLEDPRHLRNGSLPRIDFDNEGSSFKLDPDASKPRPFLNLVRPTPTPSPAPEKQIAEEESKEASASTKREATKSTASDDAAESKDDTPASASSSKGVKWGENETKHYDVESPHENKDEFVSKSEVQDAVKEVQQPKPTRPTTKRSGWGAVVAGITGAGIGAVAASASEASKSSKSKGDTTERDEKSTVDEPRSTRSEAPTAEPSQVPGAFNDDLDFTATVAAGLQDTGFDPNIVINDPSFRRRESPPGSNEPRGEERDATRDETYGSRDLVEEPETYFEPAKLSKKEQRRRDKAAQRQGSQAEDVAEAAQPIVADELVEEPDSYSSSSKKKSKKSKRESANFEDAEENPRQSRRISIPVDAFEDLRNGEDEWEEPKKSKKKSKRDSEVYDSPTRSAPSEVASEFDTPSGKKSKSKSKRKSGSYEVDPDPADIALPQSEPSEISRDGADSELRRSRRSSRRGDEDRGESQSVASAEDESRKSKKKSRSSTKDEFDDTRSVASAPVEDDFEYSKSRKKDKRSSGGGFFGMFGSKSDVGTGGQSPKALKDDFEEDTRKKSKKSKRQSLQDEPAAEVDDQPRSSSNGHSRSNGSRDDDDYASRTDGESKKSRSKSESASAENDSFLDNAGILGAGAGLAGVAIALAAQHHQQSKADLEKSSTAIEPTHSDRSVPSQQYDTIVDPEIVQRQFRPSIDPQYGDLLPLPPSGPTSPSLESFDELPELPDSRPDTPEAERFPRDRGMSTARKNLQDAPVKSPSQSAVPLKFIMGNRSVPSSPGMARSSPMQSPVTQQESLASPRNRPRPTSWDSTKEYKPLYLVENNRRNSVVQHNEPEEPLPELPPSQSTSRSGSEVDFHDAVSELGPDESSDEVERSTQPLSIDTVLHSTEARSELLDSQQSTPKAALQPQDIESSRGIEEVPDSNALPSLPPSSSLLLSGGDATPPEKEETGAEIAAAAAVASSIGYFASSPGHRVTNQAWLDDLASSPPAQPSPVDPMTKDRSSYLLQSSPLSKKAEDDEASDPNLDSSTNRQLFSNPDGDSLQRIDEREGDIAPETEPELPATTSTDAEPADEFFMTSTKKSKKDKKKAKQLARSATLDDISIPETSQEPPKDGLAIADADPIEEPSSGKSKKSKKKDKKAKSASLDWEPQEAESAAQAPADPIPETSQEPSDEPSASDDFAAVKTKGKKKKDKKKSRLSVSWDDALEDSATPSSVDPEPAQETSREVVDAAEPEDSKPAEAADNGAQSSISQEMLKGLGIWGASSLIENKKEDSSTAQEIEEPAAVEALPRDLPAEENAVEAPGIEETGKADEAPSTSATQEPDAGDEFVITSSKKSKKKGKKSRVEQLDEESSFDTATSTDRSTSQVDAAEVSRPANVMEDFFEQVSRSGSKKSKKKSKKSKSWDEEVAEQEEAARELPLGEPESTREAAVGDDPVSPKTDYFPSASHLHSPKKHSESSSGGYFPSATAVLPIAAAGAAIIGSSLLEKAKDQETPEGIQPQDLANKSVEGDELPQSEIDSKATAPDGFKAGYDNDQLALARQLQEEFSSGSKKSKKDKKKRQSLPPTSDREDSRSRAAESEADIQPRARSLSVEPSPAAEAAEETPADDKVKAVYSEDQLDLARQLKAEFESGNKKSKKDKKKRPGLSRSATFDEQALDSGAEPSPSFPPESAVEPAEPEDSAKGDGFAAGYQEDQLSLARQLQAEFGSGSKKSKKDKKGKKRESISQTPTLESENTSDYFGDAAQASGSDFLQNDDPVESPESSTRDGLAVGYSAEQLELARQLKEEFGSRSSKKDKKDKKDKKRKSLLRNSSEDPEETQPPPEADLEMSNLDAAEAASIEPTAADLDDEFTLTTKKKGKKGKKRDSLVPKSDSKDDEIDPEDTPDQELEPVPVDVTEPPASANPEDEFAPVSKKGKKGKKGKKQDITFEPEEKDPAPEPVSNDRDVELDLGAPAEADANELAADDEFAFVSKKSKKGKKGKKQEDTFEPDDKEPAAEEPFSADKDVEPDVAPLPETNEPVDDEFAYVSKKSKKGKKGKKGKKQAAAFESDEKEPAEEPAPESLSADKDLEPDSTPVLETTEPADDEFASFSKKSKKGKKGKKQEVAFESDDKEPALEPVQDSVPDTLSTDKEVEPEVALLPEASVPAADDDFAFVSKKSKKGKKGKKRADAWDEEPSPETASQETDVQPESGATAEERADGTFDRSAPAEKEFTAEETGKDENLETTRELPEEPIEEMSFEDQVRALHDASAPQPAEPNASLGEDPPQVEPEEFLFTTKKSKKGKKKQQNPSFEEPAEPSVTPLDVQPEQAGEPTIESQSPTADVEPVVNTTELVAEPDNTFEDFGFSTKKSKKDKKKRRSQLAAAFDEELEPSPSDSATGPADSSEPQPAASLETTEQVEPATGDATPAENIDDSAKDISTEPAQEVAEEPVDDWSAFSTKKSKKDKKKRKSGISTPADAALDDAVPAESLDDTTAKDISTEPAQEATEEPVDDWSAFSTKKSKKDKKKRKSGISTPTDEAPAVVEEDKPTVTEPIEEAVLEPAVAGDNISTDPAPQQEPPSEPADDEWGTFSTKKSKKDKKKRKSGLSTPAEDEPASTETEKLPEGDALDELGVVPTPVDETIPTIPEPAEEAIDEWGSFSTKKSKKDKKKRKSGLSTPAEDTPASIEEEKPRELEALEEPEVVAPSIDDAAATVLEPVEEANDEWSGFSTKKSKKDKKKRKSGLSTPAEEPPASIEDDKPREVEDLEEPEPAPTLIDDTIAAAAVFQDDPTPETVDANDEWGSFSTKKSKKDKKKRKSGLSTPAEASTSLVEEEKPAAAEEISELQQESSPVGEDLPAPKSVEDDAPKEREPINEASAEAFEFTTKKSKKDKKKAKKASLFTAADDEPAVGSIQLEKSPQESAELERDLPDSQEVQTVPPEPSDQANEDDFGFATKKSKKSKKAKRESQNEAATEPEPSEYNAPSQEESQARETTMLEPMPELTPTDTQGPTTELPETTSEHPELASSGNEWTLKHDKRKRQATVDAAISKDSSNPQPISWADEVEEAEVERQLPVIDDIAKDESLSHIASTTHVDDFSRPTKKGKKGKKGKKVDLAEFTAVDDSSRDTADLSTTKEEPIQESRQISPALAAAGAIIGGAALLGKSDDTKAKTFNEDLEGSRDVQQPREPVDLGVSEPEVEPVTPVNTKRYSHPGSSTLPVVEEESPDPIAPRPQYAQDIDDANRDSAFVTESPVPRQRGFNDDLEYNRDSGVHLRESSPYDKARAAASTDDALARMSWPPIDEESETVDLHRSQRRQAEVYEKPHHDAEEPHSKQRSLPSEDKDISFSQRRKHEDEDSPAHHLSDHHHRLSPAQLHREEPPPKHIRLNSPKHNDEIPAGIRDLHTDARDDLPSQRGHSPKLSGLHRSPAVYTPSKLKEESTVRQRVQRIESPDSTRSQKPSEEKYGDLGTARRSKAEKPSSAHSSPAASGLGITGAAVGFAASRIASQEHRGIHNQSPGTSPRSLSNINRLRSPDPRTPVRPDSRGSNPSSVTPPLRRSDRKSGDLRSLSQRSKPDLAKEAELAALTSPSTTSVNTANPTANEGRVRAKEMADVYDGFGEGRMGSPRSPTRPHSMRRRQSMQVLDLESRLEQLAAENRQLSEARAQAEHALQATQHSSATLVERDAEIESLKRTLDWLQNEVTRLTEVNDGLNSANITLGNQHNERYGALESQHAQTSRELEDVRESHNSLLAGVGSMEDKDREIAQLRADLEAAKDRIREMQVEILASKSNDTQFLVIRDEDYFDSACQKLCQHVQQWVLRFSKFSDMRACRLTSEINNDKTIDRLDNAILDGSDVDSYLSDRVKRRDVFMSMTMTMVWEFVFTRYLFGMDREQRQKLKSLEKLLSEVGPASAVHQWRATTLTLLAKREAFAQQREQDTLAVVHAIMETLSEILPPPSNLEEQIQEQLVRVIKAAVDLSIEMRTQRAEYMMLPPLQPEYDANGDLASKVNFNAALMNERSGDTVSNEELEEAGAVVKIVLFPLVVKKGDDSGEGDEEIVVCPAQVLVAKPKKSVRVFSPGSVANQSRVSMQSTMPAEQQWERVDM